MDEEPTNQPQSSTLAPAQPAYVLRGHQAQVHALCFLRQNLRLISGDAEGWVVVWDIPIRRPVAVWRAHKDTILGVGNWGDDRIITQGRDSKLHVWQLRSEDEGTFSTTLPVEDAVSERQQPWLLHSLTVNTMNFCSFAMCTDIRNHSDQIVTKDRPNDPASILVATPGVQDGSINITSLPAESRVATTPLPKDVKTGMVMAIALHYKDDQLSIVAGYESGHVAVWQKNHNDFWQTIYVNKAHSQPILSLGICAQPMCFFSSSADAVIARHPSPSAATETKFVQTKHAGQQALTVRSDQKIFATAGWDGRARVYSTKTMKELAVLKWHKEGCYAIAFAKITCSNSEPTVDNSGEQAVTRQSLNVSHNRIEKAKSTHWLACGSKDGKISLWDVY